MAPLFSWWGRWFPSGGPFSWWRKWFPEADIEDTVPGTEPAGAAAFSLQLDGLRVTYAWRSGVFKAWNGVERRSSILDDPAQRFEGSALLVGDGVRQIRSHLAQYASAGQPFLLGLPFEELTIKSDSTGTTVSVESTALSDWAMPGIRVIVRHARYGSIEAVIQSVAADEIELDETLGDIGRVGASIMPALQVYLDARQGFQRYRPASGVETWQLRGRNAVGQFRSVALNARLYLTAPLTTGDGQGVYFKVRSAGAAGNSVTLQFIEDGGAVPEGELGGSISAPVISFVDGATTWGDVATLLAGHPLIQMLGAWDGADVLTAATDEFPATAFSGGAESEYAEVGTGATVATFRGWDVWDRGIDIDQVAPDSLQSMTQAQDLGGLPFVGVSAEAPDWGRHVQIDRNLGAEFQWFKRFLDGVRGRWRSWWLPTFRADLVSTATGTGTLTVETASESGGFYSWWPRHDCLRILQADGTETLVRISATTNNGDGTATLSIVDEDDIAVTLGGSAVSVVSWLERVRFESDEIDVGFRDAKFLSTMVARVVRQDADIVPATLAEAEAGVETSQPREGIHISSAVQDWRLAAGTRDIDIDGATFRASPIGREAIEWATSEEDAALTIQMPVSHALPRRWLAGGIPPHQEIAVYVWRKQSAGDPEITWRGVITNITPREHVAVLRVESRLTIAVGTRLPTMTAGRQCSAILYDENCGLVKADYATTRNIITINGTEITFDGLAVADDFFEGGELYHPDSGERMTVTASAGNTVTIQQSIYELGLGDEIQMFPGCPHDIDSCDLLYANFHNFRGLPQLPRKNVFRGAALGFGVSEQEEP